MLYYRIPAGLEPVTISQRRTFINFGVRMEVKA